VRRRILIVLWLTAAIGIVACLAWSSFAPTGALHRRSVEKTMREVGGLAPIPKSARDVRVASHWFSVTASFTAQPEEIQRWLKQSSGLQGITGHPVDNGRRMRFVALPGNDQSVTITIDEATNRVDLVVYGDPL